MIGGRHFWGERGRLSFNKELKMKSPKTNNQSPKEAMIYPKSSAYGHAGSIYSPTGYHDTLAGLVDY